MSDDTPTQRFPEQGGSTPTERIATGEVYEELGEEKQKSRGLLVGLIIAGALLLVAIVVIVIIFLSRNSGDPVADPGPLTTDTGAPAPTESATPSDTPVATPTPEPTETQAPPPPPPPPSGPAIQTFSVSNKTVYCNTQSPNPSHQYIQFKWDTDRATHVYFGVETTDASTASLFSDLPSFGTSTTDFPEGYQDYEYACPSAQHTYTLTAVDDQGRKVSKTIKITNKGDTQ